MKVFNGECAFVYLFRVSMPMEWQQSPKLLSGETPKTTRKQAGKVGKKGQRKQTAPEVGAYTNINHHFKLLAAPLFTMVIFSSLRKRVSHYTIFNGKELMSSNHQ